MLVGAGKIGKLARGWAGVGGAHFTVAALVPHMVLPYSPRLRTRWWVRVGSVRRGEETDEDDVNPQTGTVLGALGRRSGMSPRMRRA